MQSFKNFHPIDSIINIFILSCSTVWLSDLTQLVELRLKGDLQRRAVGGGGYTPSSLPILAD